MATSTLIATNVRWLKQALALIERLDDRSYRESPAGMEPHRAGAHLRHILEFYQCFLDGLEKFHIDYDARRRDAAIEHSRVAAGAAIRSVIRFLEECPAVACDSVLWVRMEDGPEFLESSVCRELQVLSSHTVHHFALMAMTLRLHGVAMDPDFGMAPSTLRYLAGAGRAA